MLIDQQLYEKITQVFPRPCADIRVQNTSGKVLLMFRANQPFKGQWWFPGGRVHFNETRLSTASRKLHEECDLAVDAVLEKLSTHDLFFTAEGRDYHDITTLFGVVVQDNTLIKPDSQALDFGWFSQGECESLNLHPYISKYTTRAITI
jgi:colanic acid biosynthesis protein WcaH